MSDGRQEAMQNMVRVMQNFIKLMTGQTDGRITVTLRLPLDSTSLIKTQYMYFVSHKV